MDISIVNKMDVIDSTVSCLTNQGMLFHLLACLVDFVALIKFQKKT